MKRKSPKAREILEPDESLAKHVGCTSPLPGRCPLCKKGNMGVGFDFCYLRHALFDPRGNPRIRRMVEALESIAKNTCCDKCREAALVAREALEAVSEFGDDVEGR